LLDIVAAFPLHFTSSGSGNRYCVTLVPSTPSSLVADGLDDEVMDEKEGGEPGAVDDDENHERKDVKDDLDDEPQSDQDDETIENCAPVIEKSLDDASMNGALIIVIDILTAVPHHVLLASHLMARYLNHPQRSSSSDGTSLGLMDLHHLVERYPKQLIAIGNGSTCVIGLIITGSSKQAVTEHAKQLSISSLTRENTHEAADVISELLMSSANYTLTWSQLTGQYRVRLPDGPFVRQVIGLWPNQFHVTDNNNVTLIMNNNDPLIEDDEAIIGKLHDDNDNNDPGGDGSNDGFEHGVNAKQRKKLARFDHESESKDVPDDCETKVAPASASYRASKAEMKLIVPLWVKMLTTVATRTLPSLSLCEAAKTKLGLPITNDSVLDIIDRSWEQFVYSGYGSTRVITYIDRSIFTGSSHAEVVQAARKCSNDESKMLTTRQDGREAADALEILLHNAGGTLPIDSIGEPIRQQLPDSPLIIRVVELYHDRFALHNRNVRLRRSAISKNSVATTESKLPITSAATKTSSSSSSSSLSDVDILVDYLKTSGRVHMGRVHIGPIGSSFKARTGRSIGPVLKKHQDRFVLKTEGSATFVSLGATASSKPTIVTPVSNVASGSSFASVVAGTALLLPTLKTLESKSSGKKAGDAIGEFKSANPAVNEAARILAEQLLLAPDRTMLADKLIDEYMKRTGKPLPVPFLKIMNLFQEGFVIGGFGASRAICLVDSSGLAKAKTRSHTLSKASVTRENSSDAVEVVDSVLRDAGKSLSWTALGEEYRRRSPQAPFVFPVVQLFPERFHVTGGMVSRIEEESEKHVASSVSLTSASLMSTGASSSSLTSVAPPSSSSSTTALMSPINVDLERRLVNVLSLKGPQTTAMLGEYYTSMYRQMFPGMFSFVSASGPL
jgi:hypothetical protein